VPRTPTSPFALTLTFVNQLTQTATDLQFIYFISPAQPVGISLLENAPGCPQPSIADRQHVFNHEVVVDWRTLCVDPGELVRLGFTKDGFLPCGPAWTLNGFPIAGSCFGPTATPSPTATATATATASPTATPTPTPVVCTAAVCDGRLKKVSSSSSVVLSDGTADTKAVVIQVRNEGTATELFGVYVDIVPPGGVSNPYGCTPIGRIIDTVVTLAPDEQTVVQASPTFDCADVPGALDQTYTIKAAVDVHADDGGACGPFQIQSMACFNALADDDNDDADNRLTTSAFSVK